MCSISLLLVISCLLSAAAAAQRHILIGQGGCDIDDPDCTLPDATSLIAATMDDDEGTLIITSVYEGIDAATWILPYGGSASDDFLVTETASNQVYSMGFDRSDFTFHQNWNVTVGPGPVHLATIFNDTLCVSANYDGGSFSVFSMTNPSESVTYEHSGSGPNPDRQEAPHVHSVYHRWDHSREVHILRHQIDSLLVVKIAVM